MPVLPTRSITDLAPAPTITPNRSLNTVTALPFEGRTEPHQFRDQYPVEQFHVTRIGANQNARPHPDLPPQTLWGFNLGGEDLSVDPPLVPGPTIVARYGTPVLVRRYNGLPPAGQNGGFGVPEVNTHLHNFHSGPDSDGGPCDPKQQRFFFRGQYYDYFYSMQYAGFASTHPPHGDVREALGTLFYHDHRVGHTAENVYKGLAGFFIAFNEFDTGDETTGLHLPSFPQYDIPMMLSDKLFDPRTGLLYFNSFGFDGLVGDTYLVNGKVQPFFETQRRRYRFRILDAGPSRFYQLFLTNPDNLAQRIPFWVIASDGNLLPRPVEVTSIRLGVAERFDIIVDFDKIAARFGNPTRVHLENRLEQTNGRGPTDQIFAAGRGDFAGRVPTQRRTGERHQLRSRTCLDPARGVQPDRQCVCSDRTTVDRQRDTADHTTIRVRPGRWSMADQRPAHGLHEVPIPGTTKHHGTVDPAQQLRWLAAPHPRPPGGVPHHQQERTASEVRFSRFRPQRHG